MASITNAARAICHTGGLRFIKMIFEIMTAMVNSKYTWATYTGI
jgi:hypothetical protein